MQVGVKRYNRITGEAITNVVTIIMIANFLLRIDYSRMDILVLFTSFLIGGISLTIAIRSKENVSPRRVFYIFVFVFMFAAPLQQYSQDIVLWRSWGFNQSFTNSDRLSANVIILISMIMIEVGYRSHYRFTIRNTRRKSIFDKIEATERVANSGALFLLVVISLLSFIFLLLNGNILTNYTEIGSSSNLMIQIVNIAKYAPVAVLIFYILQMKTIDEHYKRSHIVFLLIQILIVSIIYFPFSGSSARFLLFGAYVSIYTAYFSEAKNKGIFLCGFLFGFFYVFSLFNVFKTVYMVEIRTDFLKVDLTGNDFDAYQILMTAIKYVKEEGICFGGNFVTALLCFIPRSILPFRMENSGALFMSFYSSGFVNVSCPIFAELFFAFGWLGLPVLSFILGVILKKLSQMNKTTSTYKKSIFCLLSGLFIYISRGSLLVAWSYTFAFLISISIVYFVSQWYTGRAYRVKDVVKSSRRY